MTLSIQEKLSNSGFIIQRNLTELDLSERLLKRYPNLPKEYLSFLKTFKAINTTSETSWFISNNDFDGRNEFELMSLEWSEDDKDELETIKNFWKNHIPILISVKDGYQFWAICLINERHGEIVHGAEPVFEETTKVCNSFHEFIDFTEKGQSLTIW